VYIDVPWDTGTVPVKLDADRLAGLVEPRTVQVRDEADLLHSVLREPDGAGSFPEFLDRSDDPILFLVNDGTRPTPTYKVLDIIHEELAGRQVEFLVATGSHKAPTSDDLEQIFGREGRARWFGHIFHHDARDAEQLKYLGETSRGTPIWVNKKVCEATRLVLINSVEPHYFAGYTGGRKTIFPGVAGFETIQCNHRLALDPAANILSLEGNPVHEDLEEALQALGEKDIYSIQMVLDRQHRIHSAQGGDLHESFMQAVKHADDHYVVEIDAAAPIVVTVAGYPMDYDLYQSQKAMENGAMALEEGGILILVSKCRHGIGDETFFNLLARASTPQAALRSIEGKYVLGYHKAARLAHIASRGEMWAVTGIPNEDLEAAFIRPFASVQAAIDAALSRKGPEARVLFLLDGSVTVPRVREGAAVA
jgi:nickel-dependent lactate racemase